MTVSDSITFEITCDFYDHSMIFTVIVHFTKSSYWHEGMNDSTVIMWDLDQINSTEVSLAGSGVWSDLDTVERVFGKEFRDSLESAIKDFDLSD